MNDHFAIDGSVRRVHFIANIVCVTQNSFVGRLDDRTQCSAAALLWSLSAIELIPYRMELEYHSIFHALHWLPDR